MSEQDDWEAHRELVQKAREKFNKTRYKKKVKKPGEKSPAKLAKEAKYKKIEDFLNENGYTMNDLFGYFGRKMWEKKTPEQKAAMSKRSRQKWLLAKRFCDHKRRPAILRTTGVNKGYYVCPSCRQRVPFPKKQKEEDFVV